MVAKILRINSDSTCCYLDRIQLLSVSNSTRRYFRLNYSGERSKSFGKNSLVELKTVGTTAEKEGDLQRMIYESR